MLVLNTDRAEALAYKYKTLFEQSDTLVKIAANNFDQNGNIIEGSQIVTKADMNLVASGLFDDNGALTEGAGLITRNDVASLFAIDRDGNLKSIIGVSTTGIKIQASHISLEGLITANENFKILQDGSIEPEMPKYMGRYMPLRVRLGLLYRFGTVILEGKRLFRRRFKSPKTRSFSKHNRGNCRCVIQRCNYGRFGVKAVGSNLGRRGNICFANTSGQTYPNANNSYAGYFDGGVHVNGNLYGNEVLSNSYGTAWSIGSDGIYNYRKGITNTIDWSIEEDYVTRRYHIEVVNGIIVDMYKQ